MTTLRDLLQQAMTDRQVTSGRALAELAAKHGQKIDRTQVNQIVAGTYKSKPGRPLLEAVAWLAHCDLETVYEAANLPLPGPSFADELPPDVDHLSPHQRHAVITVIRALLSSAEDGRGEGRVDSPAATKVPDISPAPPNERLLARAARKGGLTEQEQAEEQMRLAMAERRESDSEASEEDESDQTA